MPQATTDLACTSRPTLVRSRSTGASRKCRHYRPGSPRPATHDNLRARPRPGRPGTSIPYRLKLVEAVPGGEHPQLGQRDLGGSGVVPQEAEARVRVGLAVRVLELDAEAGRAAGA